MLNKRNVFKIWPSSVFLLPLLTAGLVSWGCGDGGSGRSSDPRDRLGVQNPERIDEPTLIVDFITEISDAGALQFSMSATLYEETKIAQTWSQLLGEPRLFLKVADLESFEVQKTATNESFLLVPPAPGFFSTTNMSRLFDGDLQIHSSSGTPWTNTSLRTPARLGDFTNRSPLSQRVLANCTPSGSTGTEASQIGWLNRNRNRISLLFETLNGSAPGSRYEDIDDGLWRTEEGFLMEGPGLFRTLFTLNELNALDTPIDDGFGGVYFESDIRVGHLTLRRETSQTLRLKTNPPIDLNIRLRAIERKKLNIIYQGGCL